MVQDLGCMRFNVENCRVMHFGKSNLKAVFYMTDDAGNEKDIEETNLERNLGVIFGNGLKWRERERACG